MTSNLQPHESVDRLAKVFEDLLNTIPRGSATIQRSRTPANDGTLLWLKPSNPEAAEFSAHIEDNNSSLIDVSFGSGTTLELPIEANLPEEASFGDMLQVVRELGAAVVAGRCHERFGWLGIKGTICVDAQSTYHSTRYFHLHLMPRTVHYRRYCNDLPVC